MVRPRLQRDEWRNHATSLTVEQLIAHVGNRVPVLAAGMLRTPEQAQAALNLGLSLVTVGKGLVMNPDWVGLAESSCGVQIRQELELNEREKLSIPDGLWQAIEAAPGWIPTVELAPQVS